MVLSKEIKKQRIKTKQTQNQQYKNIINKERDFINKLPSREAICYIKYMAIPAMYIPQTTFIVLPIIIYYTILNVIFVDQKKNDSNMHQVYLALGSNLGDKKANIKQAIDKIATHIGKVILISEMHQTEPMGFESDNDFINVACLVETSLAPLEVLSKSQDIEREMGRNSKSTDHQYADRIIDIDILFYGNKAHLSLELTLPHPQIQNRMFVLAPLADIAPTLMHPILNMTIEQLKQNLDKK